MTPYCTTTQESVVIDGCDESLKNILLVDDDHFFLFSLARHFRRIAASLNIYTAANGKQARSILSTVPVDLVISDLKMPVMDGMELALWLSEVHPQIPAIIMSGCVDPKTRAKLDQKGFPFVEKPQDQRKLFDIVHSLVSARSGARINLTSQSSDAEKR